MRELGLIGHDIRLATGCHGPGVSAGQVDLVDFEGDKLVLICGPQLGTVLRSEHDLAAVKDVPDVPDR
ncbi:hypothetical protein ABN034_33785 [Actinopolymorpha sp. B11F2]|uniref:hypothetical protein n=1 Tax=Actinopolymorpha sp. B11F2 TaxID=3160862 RepID=UPI0032E42BAB